MISQLTCGFRPTGQMETETIGNRRVGDAETFGSTSHTMKNLMWLYTLTRAGVPENFKYNYHGYGGPKRALFHQT